MGHRARLGSRPSLSTVRELLPDANHEMENREVERREIEDITGVITLPGAAQLLNSLPENRWTIATSCTRALALVRLRAAGLPIPSALVTATDVNKGKPNPEPYAKAAAKLGFDPQKCVVVEDAPAGVRAGREAGARVIGLPAIVSRDELLAAGATWIVSDCTKISVQKSNFGLVLVLTN
jgi:sugar-phosphatase